MIKLYYKTTGEEPDVNCIEPCKYDCRPSEGTMIGSCSCKECSYCYGWDMEECWVKCLKHAMEKSIESNTTEPYFYKNQKNYHKFNSFVKKLRGQMKITDIEKDKIIKLAENSFTQK